jgi:hypothetical protein
LAGGGEDAEKGEGAEIYELVLTGVAEKPAFSATASRSMSLLD